MRFGAQMIPTRGQPGALSRLGNRRAGDAVIPAPSFDPATLFSGGGVAGWWRDPSDLSTQWQDSAKTTPAAVGSPVGFVADKSGNGNHWLQATSAKRLILRKAAGLYYWETDGVDDEFNGLGTSSYTTSMDVFQALAPAAGETSFVTIYSQGTGGYAGVAIAGDAGAPDNNAGTPAYYVDKTLVSPSTRAGIATALPPLATHLFEIRDINLSSTIYPAWVEDRWGGYTGVPFAGRLYGTIGVPLAVGAANRAGIESYFANRAGLAL